MTKEKKGQKHAVCSVSGCEDMGRVLARLGGIEIAYCGKHRKKYGEPVINALINARFNGQLAKFLSEQKKEFTMNPNSELCDVCKQKTIDYIATKVEALKKLDELYEQVITPFEEDEEDIEYMPGDNLDIMLKDVSLDDE